MRRSTVNEDLWLVAQAMFKRKHRRRIHEKCPQISFIQVKCAEDVRLQRLEAREEGIGRELGEKMRADFQEGQDTILRTDCGGLNTRLERAGQARVPAAGRPLV